MNADPMKLKQDAERLRGDAARAQARAEQAAERVAEIEQELRAMDLPTEEAELRDQLVARVQDAAATLAMLRKEFEELARASRG